MIKIFSRIRPAPLHILSNNKTDESIVLLCEQIGIITTKHQYSGMQAPPDLFTGKYGKSWKVKELFTLNYEIQEFIGQEDIGLVSISLSTVEKIL